MCERNIMWLHAILSLDIVSIKTYLSQKPYSAYGLLCTYTVLCIIPLPHILENNYTEIYRAQVQISAQPKSGKVGSCLLVWFSVRDFNQLVCIDCFPSSITCCDMIYKMCWKWCYVGKLVWSAAYSTEPWQTNTLSGCVCPQNYTLWPVQCWKWCQTPKSKWC